MKKVIAFVKPFKLNRILDIIIDKNWDLLFIQEVKEFNLKESMEKFLPRFQLQFWISKEEIPDLKKIISKYNFSFESSNEDIYIYDVDESVDLDDGERKVIQNSEN